MPAAGHQRLPTSGERRISQLQHRTVLHVAGRLSLEAGSSEVSGYSPYDAYYDYLEFYGGGSWGGFGDFSGFGDDGGFDFAQSAAISLGSNVQSNLVSRL